MIQPPQVSLNRNGLIRRINCLYYMKILDGIVDSFKDNLKEGPLPTISWTVTLPSPQPAEYFIPLREILNLSCLYFWGNDKN